MKKVFYILLLLSGSVFAGHGTRGGGHIVEVDGTPELLDIVTKAKCDWYSGKDMILKYPSIQEILNKIEKLDWYLASELKREIEFLTWCMTGPLYSTPAKDEDSFVQQEENANAKQVAFRLDGSAYMDEEKFLELKESSRGLLVFHETLHSYLPMSLRKEMRIFKLHSLVSTINKVFLGQIESRDSLHTNLKGNKMLFPLTVEKLTPYKKSLNFVFSSKDQKVETVLATEEPEKILHSKLQKIVNFIAKWDQKQVEGAENLLIETIKDILKEGKLQQVSFLLNEQEYQKLNPASIALSIYSDLDQAVQKEVTNSKYFSKILQEAQTFINAIEFEVINSRIKGDLNLQLMSHKCLRQNPLYTIALRGIQQNDNCSLPIKIRPLIDLLAVLIETNQVSALSTNFENNQELIDSLKMKSPIGKLNNLKAPIEREKNPALKALYEIQEDLVDKIKDELSLKVSNTPETVKNFLKKLEEKN